MKEKTLSFRCTEEEKAAWIKAAHDAGLSLTDCIRVRFGLTEGIAPAAPELRERVVADA